MAQDSKKRPKAGKSRAKKPNKAPKKPGIVRRVWRLLWRMVFGLIAVSVLLVLLFRFVNPTTNFYMMSEARLWGGVKKSWVELDQFHPNMPRAVVAAEDANFCWHKGFDIDAIKEAIEEGGRRGASTISQQVAKNVFLWPGRTFLRKGLEAYFTVLLEILWPKERILEVYLNIAEFDRGVFGAAAASRHYFGSAPGRITELQAARLAAILPNPKGRSASRPSDFVRKRTRAILAGSRTIAQDGRAKCFTPQKKSG